MWRGGRIVSLAESSRGRSKEAALSVLLQEGRMNQGAKIGKAGRVSAHTSDLRRLEGSCLQAPAHRLRLKGTQARDGSVCQPHRTHCSQCPPLPYPVFLAQASSRKSGQWVSGVLWPHSAWCPAAVTRKMQRILVASLILFQGCCEGDGWGEENHKRKL